MPCAQTRMCASRRGAPPPHPGAKYKCVCGVRGEANGVWKGRLTCAGTQPLIVGDSRPSSTNCRREMGGKGSVGRGGSAGAVGYKCREDEGCQGGRASLSAMAKGCVWTVVTSGLCELLACAGRWLRESLFMLGVGRACYAGWWTDALAQGESSKPGRMRVRSS